jgi:hypothetical protein
MEEDVKKIFFQENIKKIEYKKERKKRVEVEKWHITDEDLIHSNQLKIVNNLFLNKDTKQDAKHNIFRNHIKCKLSSYKQQDINKKKYDSNLFTSLQHVLDLLVSSQLKCCYCSNEVYILYELVRESKQWSLDRINNDIGHNINNLVISCLDCNLKRRRTNKDSFMFTKNMKIIRMDFS